MPYNFSMHACMCIKEYESSSSSNSSSSSSSSASGLSLHSRTRKEPLEQRLNAFINKHVENGMIVSSLCTSDGCVLYIIGCAYCQDISYPTSNNTWAANWEQHVSPTQPNTQKGSQANHFTQKQKFVNQSILTNFGFTSSSIPVT